MIFSLISGLKINFHNSVIYGMSCDAHLAIDLGCQVRTFPMKYLGLPLGGRALCCAESSGVIESFRSMLSLWKAKYLSMGRHLTSIKSVLNSVSIYTISVRLLLVRVRNSLHGIMSRFLWGGSEDRRKLHLVDWYSAMKACSKGGLGVPNLGEMNAVLLVK